MPTRMQKRPSFSTAFEIPKFFLYTKYHALNTIVYLRHLRTYAYGNLKSVSNIPMYISLNVVFLLIKRSNFFLGGGAISLTPVGGATHI